MGQCDPNTILIHPNAIQYNPYTSSYTCWARTLSFSCPLAVGPHCVRRQNADARHFILHLLGANAFFLVPTYHGPSLCPTPEHPRPTLHLTLAGRERFLSRAHFPWALIVSDARSPPPYTSSY